MLEYSSIAELCRAAEQAGSTISQTALADQAEQMEQPADVLYQRMADSLEVQSARAHPLPRWKWMLPSAAAALRLKKPTKTPFA